MRPSILLRVVLSGASAAGSSLPKHKHSSSAPSSSAAAVQSSDPASSTRLVDRLKDCKLQGYWHEAWKLFFTAHTNKDIPSRWMYFHYNLVIDLLGDAREYEKLRTVWDAMKQRQTNGVDERSGNNALRYAVISKNKEFAADVLQYLKSHEIPIRYTLERDFRLLQLRGRPWREALGAMGARTKGKGATDVRVIPRRPSPVRLPASAPTVPAPNNHPSAAPLTIADVNDALRVADDAFTEPSAVLAAVESMGFVADGDTYAALINNVPSTSTSTARSLYEQRSAHGCAHSRAVQ